jgi:hypothetical protein
MSECAKRLMNRVDVNMRPALLLGNGNLPQRMANRPKAWDRSQNTISFGLQPSQNEESPVEIRPTLAGRFQRWVQRGMPLEWWVNYEAEEKLEKPEKQKLFWKKRLPLVPFLGALALGVWYSPQLDKPLPAPLSRASQPAPWGENVRFYASSSQNNVSMTYMFPYTLFYSNGAGGGTFMKALTDAVQQNPSLDQAFNTMLNGYGPWNRFKPVKSVEGPSIFNKDETGKTRKLFIIRGSGINDENHDANAENLNDVELARKTFQSVYHLKDEEIVIVHQPTPSELTEIILKEKENPPDEVSLIFVGEGAVVDYGPPLKKGQRPLSPEQEALEGGKNWAFSVNDGEFIDEYDLKKMVQAAFTKTDPGGKVLKQSKIAMIADSCRSGAATQ